MWTKITALACAAVILGGCGSRKDSGAAAASDPTPKVASSSATDVSVVVPSTTSVAAPSTSRTPSPATTAGPGAVITLAASQFGQVLFDGSGQAIYLFDAETTSTPTCYGECASAWPPVLTTDRPVAQGGVQAQLLGVTTRRDGATQVTYAGKPLYFYAHEGKNVVLCHNVREFGVLWLAITKTGAPAPT